MPYIKIEQFDETADKIRDEFKRIFVEIPDGKKGYISLIFEDIITHVYSMDNSTFGKLRLQRHNPPIEDHPDLYT